MSLKKSFLNVNELTLGEDDVVESETSQQKEKEYKQIPKSVFGQSLKELEGYDDKRKELKSNKMEQTFIDEIGDILAMFDTKDKKYDSKTLLWVANCAENYFTKAKSGVMKEKAVVKLVKQYYNDDEDLVKATLQLILPKVKKSSTLYRMYLRTTNFFY